MPTSSMLLDFGAFFWKKSDTSKMAFQAPVGAAYTASMFADDPAGTVELHFFDCDNRELDNTGFEACAVPTTHVGICSVLNTQMSSSAAALTMSAQCAKIRVRNTGNGNIYIGQRGDFKELPNNQGGITNLFLIDGVDVGNAEVDIIYPGGYKDVGFVVQSDPITAAVFGTPEDPPALNATDANSLVSLIKATLRANLPPQRFLGRVGPAAASSATKAWAGSSNQRTVNIQSYASPVYIKFVPMGSVNVPVSATDYSFPLPAGSSVSGPVAAGYDVWVQSAGNYSLDVWGD